MGFLSGRLSGSTPLQLHDILSSRSELLWRAGPVEVTWRKGDWSCCSRVNGWQKLWPRVEFQRYTGKHFYGWIHSEFSPPKGLLDSPERAAEFPEAEHLLDCRARQIFRLPLSVQGRLRSCFTYYFTNQSLNRSFRTTPSFHILKVSQKLQEKGLGTLKVLAALKRKRELFNWCSFLVAREITPVYELASAGNHVFQIHPFLEYSPRVAAGLAQHLASFHRKGFFHGDLKTRHILIGRHSNPLRRFYLVDLEKCHYLPHLPSFLKDVLAARDLIQLFASLKTPSSSEDADHLRYYFTEEYLSAIQLSLSRQVWLKKLLELYGPEGNLEQGQTVLTNLWKKFQGRYSGGTKRST